jgi:addiction module RelE/StbE family toxin
MYQIHTNDRFKKKAKKFLKKHQNLKNKFETIIKKLAENPFEPSLKTHKLQGSLKDLWSCSLNYEYRIILNIIIIEEEVYLIDIGTHDEVY